MDKPRNFKIENVELNWAKLVNPVSPFGTPQWELQIATSDKAKAAELKANHLNVKEKDGKFIVALKRKAKKADGSDMVPPRVVGADALPFENPSRIGNGSTGNVIVWQAPYDTMGRSGVSNSLTAVQVTNLVEYTAGGSAGFDAIIDEGDSTESAADMF